MTRPVRASRRQDGELLEDSEYLVPHPPVAGAFVEGPAVLVEVSVLVPLLQELEEPAEADPPRVLVEDLDYAGKERVEVHLGAGSSMFVHHIFGRPRNSLWHI